MARDGCRLIQPTAILDDEILIIRHAVRTEIFRRLLPSFRTAFQPVEKLPEIQFTKLNTECFYHFWRCLMASRLAEDKLELFEKPGTIPAMARSPSVPWTREHQLIALNLYRKIPFGHYDKGKPIVIQMAGLMGRSPSSLAMKLVNFASLDPLHQARGIKGLDGATKDDRKMWAEFQGNLQTLGPESEQLVHDLFTPDDSLEIDFLDGKTAVPTSIRTFGGLSTEGKATVKVRRGQQFFRQSILNAYGVRCCVSGINVPGLLVASHIRPWKDFPNDRLDPSNGLCLSALHDAAFDTGLMTLDEGFSMVLSLRLRKSLPQESLEKNFCEFEGKPIRMPDKLAAPSGEFLRYHREHIFLR